MMQSDDVLFKIPHGTPSAVTSTPQQYVSPSTRKVISVTDSQLDSINDDEAEKRKRRRSRLLELQRNHMLSPASPADNRDSSTPPLSGLTNSQLAEHYANCIKLSTENKINAKNAFGLHLIDYMAELLKKKEMTNFQVASSTLDASAKIYAGRVDAIHAETYKVLTGLGRGADKNEKEQGDGEEVAAEEEDVDQPPGAKKRKKTKQGKTIETNLKNINIQKLDLAFKADPLFHKTSAAFDEGGTAGLLLNQLHCRDDMSELILDSNTILMESHDGQLISQPTAFTKEQTAALTDLKRMFLDLKLTNAFICPEFSDFEFANFKLGGSDSFSSYLEQKKRNTFAFDLDAEVDTIPESTDTEQHQDAIDDGFGPIDDEDDGGGGGEDGGIDDDDDRSNTDEKRSSGQSILFGDSKEAQMVKNTMNNIKHGTVGTLIQVLASEPSDYSYFNTKLLQTWAGPAHWKVQPKSKDVQNKVVHNRKKEPMVLNFEEDISIDNHLKETRASTTVTSTTHKRWAKNETTLPDDLNYDEKDLFKLFTKPRVLVRRQKRQSTSNLDNDLDIYDYDNCNDKDNFCPENNQDDDCDDDRGDDFGFDFTVGPSQSQGDAVIGTDAEGFGTDLVAQPRKIARIDINYAKQAKKMDIKKLKSAMWSLLTSEPTTGHGGEGERDGSVLSRSMANESTDRREEVDKEHSFKCLVSDLPHTLPKTMADNLSVPIAFISLLHLANEKTLSLKGTEDMDDLMISQG